MEGKLQSATPAFNARCIVAFANLDHHLPSLLTTSLVVTYLSAVVNARVNWNLFCSALQFRT